MKNVKKIIKKTIELKLRTNANSNTCYAVYQPKTPKNLKQYKK